MQIISNLKMMALVGKEDGEDGRYCRRFSARMR